MRTYKFKRAGDLLLSCRCRSHDDAERLAELIKADEIIIPSHCKEALFVCSFGSEV